MRKRHSLAGSGCCQNWAILLGVIGCSALLSYALFSRFFDGSSLGEQVVAADSLDSKDSCCRGVQNLELWGTVVKWGDGFSVNSTVDCCRACKAFCTKKGVCECNSWVFCGDEKRCGTRFGQCWLKHQEDPLNPEIQASGNHVIWTSGLILDERNLGVLGMETRYGTIRMKVLVDCAPYSVAYLLQLKKLRHCAGCHIYRAEGRGSSWNEKGIQISQTVTSPYALLQGSLAVETVGFNEMPKESCPVVRRGSVGWIGGGPDFFISLAHHDEWDPKHTVFAHVMEEDMHIVETIANLPTEAVTWSQVKVALLQQAVPVKFVEASTKVASG